MQFKDLQMTRALRTALLVLLLSVVGMGKGYAFTVGNLEYIFNNDGVSVSVAGHVNGQNATGSLEIPEYVTYEGTEYSVTGISGFAFTDCIRLTGSLTIPNSVTIIGEYAFQNCSNLTGDLSIPNSVTTIGEAAFGDCFNFGGNLTIGTSVTTIGIGAFGGCSGFTGSLIIPNSITTIDDGAFSGCNGFTGSLIIPNTVTSIGRYAFEGCSGFTGSLTIPESVATIGEYAFSFCNSFTSIICLAETPPALGEEVFEDWNTDLIVYAPCGFEDLYISQSWGGFNNFNGICGGTVTVVANLEEGGTVTGGGMYEAGQICTVTATANEGYTFVKWTQNGTIVSSDAEYTFYVMEDVILEAHFVLNGNIDFADANVKNICVSYWDTNGDGELSYGEVALVTDLSDYFRNNSEITSFDELQYFVGLLYINDYAFQNCSGLTSIVLPNTVTTIGNSAFYGCSGFTGSLTIPNSVIEIGDSAYQNCSGFNGNLIIPNSVTTIGYAAFRGCNGFIGDLILPDSITSINACTFMGCSGFTGNLTIPSLVITIGNWAFSDCSSFTGNLAISNSVTSIGEYAFLRCNGFSGSLTIPNSVTTIGDYAFSSCSGFTGSLTIPNSVTTIGNNAFSMCHGFNGSLTIGNSVTTIGDHAFYFCEDFSSITCLSEAPPTLGDRVFLYLDTNISVCVPCGSEETYVSVTWGGFNNFNGICGGIVAVIPNIEEGGTVTGGGSFEAGQSCTVTAIASEGYAFVFWTQDGTIVSSENEYTFYVVDDVTLVAQFVPEGNILFADNNVKNICVSHWDTDGDNELSYKEAALITRLGTCFEFNTNITSFDELQYFIGLSSIGWGAFQGCNSLNSIVLPNVTTIDNYAFKDCLSLAGDLIIPNSVISIGEEAFYNCNGFTGNLTIGNSVTSIGEKAFYGCRGFTGDLVIPNSVTSIGDRAFMGCSGFTGNLTIGNSLTTIRSQTFYNCSGFTGSLIIGNSVNEIENYAFSGCSGFTGSLVIPNSVNTINNYAFERCSGFMGNLIIGDSVTVIGDNAFYECSGFTGSLTIPNSVTNIGVQAFYNCSGFTGSLIIGDSVTTIGSSAFRNCSGFTGYLTIGNSVTNINHLVFTGCSNFSFITCLAEIPPTLFLSSFESWNPNTPVYVSCGFEEIYSSLSWGEFNNFYGLCGGVVTVTAIPEEGGTVIGGGSYEAGQTCNVMATANDGYVFALWTQNGIMVSTDAEYSSYVANDMVLVAHFVPEGNIYFADSNVKDICVSHWDTNGDNELSYVEAASITNLRDYFQSNSQITSFDELQYFIGLYSIVEYAFSDCTGLTSIVLPNSVTNIGREAFYNCSSLAGSLTIPNSVTNIGRLAFYNCSSLTGSLTIPNSVTTIDYRAFCGCSSLTGPLIIGSSVVTIGQSAFSDCSSLDAIIVDACNSVYDSRENCNAIIMTNTNELMFGCNNTIILNSVTSIMDGAFWGCRGLISIEIPNSVALIGVNPFIYCSALEEIIVESDNPFYDSRDNCNAIIETGSNTLVSGCKNTVIPNSVTTIGNNAFFGCSSMTSIEIPNTVTSIGHSAFNGCSGMTGNLTIPNSVTSIGDEAFQDCSGFTGSLTIPNSVTSIGSDAFAWCRGFTGSLTIPNSVTSIGNYAFIGCIGLTEVLVLGIAPPSFGVGVFSLTNNCPIYVPYESLNVYKTTSNLSTYEDRIFPMAYTTIPGYGEGEGNYRFIASPLVDNTAPTTVDNMITQTAFDLYRFDQSEANEWQNYKFTENTPNFFLTNGQGYLYANAEDVNLIFKGEFNEDETKEVKLAYEANADFAGWNLVGNPFPVSAYANKSYYTMNEDGTGIEPNMVSSATAIPACTGVMVKADGQGETVIFNTTAPETASNQGGLRIALSQAVDRGGVSTGSTTLQDKAIVSFNAGDRLEKFVFNKDNARISIPQGGKDLAIACAEKQGEMPLNFKATKNGTYTLSVDVENADVDYLHLIDNLTGADIDLLALRQAQGPAEYTFTAKITDYASRFRLVFSVCGDADGDNGTFAFINNGNIIVTGAEADAVLQIVDVTGRIIVCRDAARHVSTSGMTPGVYVLRLINGDNVKTQKIVIDR